MVCRKCHATIADKAIVCYRCGTPTAEPVVTPPAGHTAARVGVGVVWAVLVALGAMFLWWQLPGPAGAPARIAVVIVAVMAVLIALLRWRRGAARR